MHKEQIDRLKVEGLKVVNISYRIEEYNKITQNVWSSLKMLDYASRIMVLLITAAIVVNLNEDD